MTVSNIQNIGALLGQMKIGTHWAAKNDKIH